MRIYGLDFTSAPGRGKPLAISRCWLEQKELVLESLEAFASYDPLIDLLRSPGPWAMGCDFPFSQSARLLQEAPEHIRDLRWPVAWEEYLTAISGLTQAEFKTLMKTCPPDARGVRERKRVAGHAANACSPQHVDFPPVGLMFHQGARLLLECPCEVVPQRPNGDSRKLFEVYPGVFAERFCGDKGYKDGKRDLVLARAAKRERMIGLMLGEGLRETYGFAVKMDDLHVRHMVEDAKGDFLDSLICAVQAAWAWSRHHENYGLPGPDEVDPDVLAFEGWIFDPHCRVNTQRKSLRRPKG
jgi:hypothetical protein